MTVKPRFAALSSDNRGWYSSLPMKERYAKIFMQEKRKAKYTAIITPDKPGYYIVQYRKEG